MQVSLHVLGELPGWQYQQQCDELLHSYGAKKIHDAGSVNS